MKILSWVTAILFGAHFASGAPAWWTQSSAQVIQTGAASNNLGVANVGQLKWMAYCAKNHLDSQLSGGAGTEVNNLVASFKPQAGIAYSKEEEGSISKDNHSALTIGQLKAVAKVFYDRLYDAGYDTRASLIANGYPSSWPASNRYAWDPATPVAANYALATVGQLKLVFSFDLTTLTCAPPVFSPGAGVYTSSVSVSLTSATSGATIRYTTDGSTPTTGSSIYSAPLNVSSTTTIKAYSSASGLPDSPVVFGTYTIQSNPVAVATPTFSPVSGTYSGPITVLIASETAGATIRYTVDGTMPTSSSPAYNGPLTVTANTTVKAMGFLNGYTNSDVATAIYGIDSTPPTTVAMPTISPNGGTYSQSVTVTLATATAGATIYYTTNGEDPTTTSQVYNGPFDLTYSATLRVKAFKTGLTDSAIAQATFIITTNTGATYSLGAFDYAILTYSWGTTDGTDLDTRTAFVNTSSLVDGQDVGWDRNLTVGDAPYLNWSGDNVNQGGSESVMIDLKSSKGAFPDVAIQHLRLRSFWFRAAASGNILVRVQTYLNGAIQVTQVDANHRQFAVTGGTLVNDISVSTHVPGSNVGRNIDGNDVGTLDYTISSKTGVFKVLSH